jgi:hypothetical protein
MKKIIGYCVRYRKSNGEWHDAGYMQPWPHPWRDTRYVWPTLPAAKYEVARRGLTSWRPYGVGVVVFIRVVRKVKGDAS